MSMSDRQGTILLTGANGGLGSAIVSKIANDKSLSKDYLGLYTVRDLSRADTVKKVLGSTATTRGHEHELLALDLGSLASTRKAADDINKRVASGELPPIRVLMLNAASQEYTTSTLTDDGFDRTFQTNHLSHFLFTLMLLQSMDKKHGRVLVPGSWSHNTHDVRNEIGPTAPSFKLEQFQQYFGMPPDVERTARGKWSSAEEFPGDLCAGYRRYGASKLCQVMMMVELSQRIKRDPALSSISVLSVDPGAMATGLAREGPASLQLLMKYLMPALALANSVFQPNGAIRAPFKSAGDVVRASFDEKLGGKDPNGLYMNGSLIANDTELSDEAKDDDKRSIVWTESVRLAGLREGDSVLAEWK